LVAAWWLRRRPTQNWAICADKANCERPVIARLAVRSAVRVGWLTAVLLASLTVPGAIHHSVVVVRDLEASLRFYRDGLGLELLQDRLVEGDWPGLLDAPGRSLRAVFLGDPRVPDDHSGVLELNLFDGDVEGGPPASARRSGFLLLSFFVDVESALGRLASLGLGGSPRRVTQPTPNGPVTIAAVRDPDGLLVLLTPGSITRRA
jgi:catechol 2,3-dioxygenase-like lactoylglutathione lyase family enzyme